MAPAAAATTHGKELLDRLAGFDTPTVCNAIETLDAGLTTHGFTHRPLICAFPDMPAQIGYARTAQIRTTPPKGESAEDLRERRFDYFGYVRTGDGPKIVVMQDLDGDAGLGACWGDVMANLHVAMGVAGVVTDGAIRDIPGIPAGIQFLATCIKPSHARLHTAAFGGTVTVAGLTVKSGDLVHMDRNGAVVIPHALADDLPAACERVIDKEHRTIAACRDRPFDLDKVKAIMSGG
jgi:regulator of RNase E activity RraA